MSLSEGLPYVGVYTGLPICGNYHAATIPVITASLHIPGKVVMDLEDGFKMKMDMDMYNMTNMTNGTMYDWMKCFSQLGYRLKFSGWREQACGC